MERATGKPRHQILPRLASVAGSDGGRSRMLRFDESVSARRSLRNDRSSSTRGGLDRRKHRGGARQGSKRLVCSVSADVARVVQGVGDAFAAGGKGRHLGAVVGGADPRPLRGAGQDAASTHSIAATQIFRVGRRVRAMIEAISLLATRHSPAPRPRQNSRRPGP